MADAINAMPPFSTFSFPSPNSNVSAVPGTLGLNLAASSTVTAGWLKQSGYGNTGWVSILTG